MRPLHLHLHRRFLLAPLAAAALLGPAPSALATFPGHEGRIAFHVITETEGTQIFTVRPNGNEPRQITHVAGDAIAPDWSPDGRRIAFEIDTPDTADVAIMNADGSGLVTVPGVGLFNGDPSFTPDGRRLVYGFFDGEQSGVASMNLDGSDQRVLVLSAIAGFTDVEDPNVSPDGRSLSVTCIQVTDVLHSLCTLPAAGGPLTPLVPFTAEVGAKSDWAPNGRGLTYTDHADRPNPGDSSNVAVVGADGTGARLLTRFAGGDVNAFAGSYSPDGKEIVFRLEDHGRFGLFTIRPDGTHVRAILPLSDLAPRFIDWGPRAREDGDD